MRLKRRARGFFPAAILCALLFPGSFLRAQDNAVPFRPAPWLSLGVELKSRTETDTGVNFEEDHRHLFTLSRLRLTAEVQAPSWLRFHVTLQDARTLAGEDPDLREQDQDELDFLDAYVEAAPNDGRVWRLRLGRQALAFGNEDLIGSDDLWSNRAQRFDALRLTLQRGAWSWDLFAGSLVRAMPGRLDEVLYTHRIAGVWGRWAPKDAGWEIQPFVLWKYAPQSDEEGGPAGWRSEWTAGVNATKEIGRGFSLSGELALQSGTALDRPLHAWAMAGELRHPFLSKRADFSVGLAQASGDHDPNDGRRGTFDDLYPAAYNGCGFLAPFAWRNLRDLHAGTNWTLGRRWSLTSELHSYWLDSRNDGVYVDEETWSAFNPQADSSRLGLQWSTLVAYRRSAHWNAAVGYAHFFAGPYLRDSGPSASGHGAFLAWTWTP